MKSWVLHRVQGIGGMAGRSDLAPHERGHGPELEDDAAPHGAAGSSADALHPGADLGVYAPLIGAVRDELEHFVVSHVRLHVVIADRDRFMLTSIGVRSPGGAEARELLQQFMHEFKPEQVKRYLAREVIGRLPNAGVIDLSLFGGLSDLEANDRGRDDGEYRELLAALRTTPATVRSYEVSVSALGRPGRREWPRRRARDSTRRRRRSLAAASSSTSTTAPARAAPCCPRCRGAAPSAGRGSDRVDGTYTSQRHAELWLDDPAGTSPTPADQRPARHERRADGHRRASSRRRRRLRALAARGSVLGAPGCGRPRRLAVAVDGGGETTVATAIAAGATPDAAHVGARRQPGLRARDPTAT